jgi:hypothetical protein
MVGFWIFVIVLTICATFVICVFLDNAKEHFPLWDTKRRWEEIDRRLKRIEEALAKMGGK